MAVTIPARWVDDWTSSEWISSTGAEFLTNPIFGTNEADNPNAAPEKFVSSYDAKFMPLGYSTGTTIGNTYPFATITQENAWTRQFYTSSDHPYSCSTRTFNSTYNYVLIKAGVYKKSRNTAVIFAITRRSNSPQMMANYRSVKCKRSSSSPGSPAPYPEGAIDFTINNNLLIEVQSDGSFKKVTPEKVMTVNEGTSTGYIYDIYKIGEYDRQSGTKKKYFVQGFFYSSTMSQIGEVTASYTVLDSMYPATIKLKSSTYDGLMLAYGKNYTAAQLKTYVDAHPYALYPNEVTFTGHPDTTLHFPSTLMNYKWTDPYFESKSWFEIMADSPCIRFSSSDTIPNGMTIQSGSQIYTSDLDSYTNAYSTPTLATKGGYPYVELKSFYTSLEKLMPADVWNYNFTVKMTFVPETNRTQFTAITLPNGTTLYDTTAPFDISYTFMAKASTTNLPTLSIGTGTRYRNHAAKYAVLANDFDYFDYTWRGSVDNYQRDPTVTLTLRYGDQIVVTKTMDGTSAAAQTFQHGPFLTPPTTEGQLVQITGIVTDRRGRKSNETTFTITDNNSGDTLEYLRFFNYHYPTVMVQGYRCLANGTPDADNGTYVKLTATYAFSPVDYGLKNYSEGTTDGQLNIKLRPHSGTLSQSDYNYTITTANGNKEIMLAVGLDQSVDIDVQVVDFIGNVFDASTEFVPSSRVVFDFRAGGSALSIGKRNEFDNALEVAWDTTFYGNVNIRGNVNISGVKQTATTADAVTYYDTYNLGARHVQAALDALAKKAGVTTAQVQSIVNQAIANLNVPNDAHINQLITTKINNIVFPPSISEAKALELIQKELANLSTGTDETAVNALIEAKTKDFVKADALNSLATKAELSSTKKELEDKIAGAGVDEEAVREIVDEVLGEQPALTAENVKYGDSNVKEALDSMGTIVETLPDAVDGVGEKVETNTGKIDAIMILLQNMGQTEWQDGNVMYF